MPILRAGASGLQALLFLCPTAPGNAQGRPPIRLVLERTIDERSGVSFGNLVRLDAAPDGSVVVADQANGVVYRFDAAGRLRDSLGRRGQGPGEFLVAAGLAVGPAGEVLLADLRTRRLTWWSAAGALLGSVPVTDGMPVDVLWGTGDAVLGTLQFGTVPRVRFRTVRRGSRDSAGTTVAVFDEPFLGQTEDAVSCGVCRRALLPGGRMLVAAPDTFYRVSEIDSSGRVLRTWKRDRIGAGEMTADEIAQRQRQLAAGPGGGRPTPEGAPRPAVPTGVRFRWRFQGVGVDAGGRILTLASNAGSRQPVVDVFAPDGRFLGSVTPAAPLMAMVVRGDRLVALSETGDGIPIVLVFRIEEVPPA